MKILFWTSALFLFYAYAGYPLVLWLWSRLFPGKPLRKDPSSLPSVTLLISAYNEKRAIAEKLDNSLALDYPRHLLEIIVISDGSTDGTNEIARGYADRGVGLRVFEGRLGKTACLNRVVPDSSGEVVVFSDANALYDAGAIRSLAANFSEPAVGFVTGSTWYAAAPGSGEAATVGMYAALEQFTKQAESRIGSCVGADGAIFAIRRHLYLPLEEADINDLVIPLTIIRRGYRGVLEPSAFCIEPTAGDARGEFRRQVRITSRTLRALFRHAALFNPFATGIFAFELFSHKAVKLMSPFFLIGFILSTAVLSRHSTGFALLLFAEVLCAALTLPRSYDRRLTLLKRLSGICSMFIAMNGALLAGWVQFLKGETYTSWSPVKR
jgi:cellulose synthase/poly-beta-1,6-N-acetylglucosamine synthase-like glycosyltransferase